MWQIISQLISLDFSKVNVKIWGTILQSELKRFYSGLGMKLEPIILMGLEV